MMTAVANHIPNKLYLSPTGYFNTFAHMLVKCLLFFACGKLICDTDTAQLKPILGAKPMKQQLKHPVHICPKTPT